MRDDLVEPVTVGDLMTTDVASVLPDATVGDALDLMFEKKISALPVVDEDQHCLGIVTATDLIVLLRATDRMLRSDYPQHEDRCGAIDLVQQRCDRDPVREIMSEVLITTTPDTEARQMAAAMSEQSIHHLPVVQDGRLVGLLSSLDFVRAWT